MIQQTIRKSQQTDKVGNAPNIGNVLKVTNYFEKLNMHQSRSSGGKLQNMEVKVSNLNQYDYSRVALLYCRVLQMI